MSLSSGNGEELKKFMDEFLIKAGNNVKKLPSKQKPYETDPSPSKELSNEDTKPVWCQAYCFNDYIAKRRANDWFNREILIGRLETRKGAQRNRKNLLTHIFLAR